MFKCKQCGRGFSANPPEHCPDCGAVNHQAETSARGVSMLLAMETLGTLAVLILIGIVVVWVIKSL